jgi:alpha-galactosidase
MNSHPLQLALLLFLACTVSAAETRLKGPVKVFILIGQSNMNGRGHVDTLRDNLIKDLPDKYPPALMKIREDVWVSGANGIGISRQMTNVRLEPGFGQFKYFGPELGFGHRMGDHFDEPVLLIKNIAGGTPLATHWTSPRMAKRTGRQGPLKGRRAGYQSTFAKVKTAVESLDTLIEGYDPSQGYQIMGVVWCHGNADGGKLSAEYEDNLVDFITDLRDLFGIPELPFIAAESLSSRAPGIAFQNAVDRVNKQAGNKQAAAILAKEKIKLKTDAAYSAYNASGDGTHWRWNPRAFLDVGYWAADLMKPMLAKSVNHGKDKQVQAALAKYAGLIEQGNAAHSDPVYDKSRKRWGDRPKMPQAGGNNYQEK